jgi:hypothetical protein
MVGISVLALAQPARAVDRIYDTHFDGGPAGTDICYAREYAARHLKKHPRQQVARIFLRFRANNPDGAQNTPVKFQLGLAIDPRTKGKEQHFSAVYCDADGSGAQCGLEGDAGRLVLTPAGPSRLRIDVAKEGLSFETGKGVKQYGGKASDDNVLMLVRAETSACPTGPN